MIRYGHYMGRGSRAWGLGKASFASPSALSELELSSTTQSHFWATEVAWVESGGREGLAEGFSGKVWAEVVSGPRDLSRVAPASRWMEGACVVLVFVMLHFWARHLGTQYRSNFVVTLNVWITFLQPRALRDFCQPAAAMTTIKVRACSMDRVLVKVLCWLPLELKLSSCPGNRCGRPAGGLASLAPRRSSAHAGMRVAQSRWVPLFYSWGELKHKGVKRFLWSQPSSWSQSQE